MKVILTKPARDDLLSIGDWFAKRSPDFAEAYTIKLAKAALKIGEYPGTGAPRPQWGPGVRASFVDRYVITYRVRGEVVEVLRIVHTARDLDTLFSSGEA